MDLDFSKEYILENDFVRICPLKSDHVDTLVTISNEPDLWTYFFEKGNGLENLSRYISSAVNKRKSKEEYPFIVFDKVKKQYAGTTRLYEYSPTLKNIKLGHTWYGKDFRGTGINKHCKYLLFQFAFEILEVARIGFGIDNRNKISIAALKSVGCKKEGVLRSFIPSKEHSKEREDLILMSLLRSEWNDHVKQLLTEKLTANI